MLVAPRVTYPGVYIQEVESDVRTIIGVATATTAFIGRAKRGPVNEPVVINSYADFEGIFGGLWLKSSLGYAVRDFYQNGGSQAVIVRLFNNSAGSSATPTPQSVAAAARAKADEFAEASAPQRDAANTVATAAETAANAADATIESVMDAANASADEVEASDASAPAKAAAKAVVDAVTTATTPPAAASPSAKAVMEFPVDDSDGDGDGQLPLTLEAVSDGEWGNQLRGSVSDVDSKVVAEIAKRYGLVGQEDELFDLTIRDLATNASEVYTNVTVIDGPRRVDKVLQSESKLVRVRGSLPPPVDRKRPKVTKRDDGSLGEAVASNGSDGSKLDDNVVTGKNSAGNAVPKTGLYALDKADIFNLLCIPPYNGDDIEQMEDVLKTIWDEAASYCTKRRALLLVDSPKAWTDKDEAKAGYPNAVLTPSANAVIYFPRIKKSNLLRDSQIETFVPCGSVAGIMARTDATRGVWKAPAGQEARISGVDRLDVTLSDLEQGELNPLGINCLRLLPAAGHVVWGARTTVGDDRLANQWKYIPVRRTALYIEETLYRNTQWAVFEPNDEPLWSQLRLNIGVFMHDLFRQGAFQGRSPREAYFVKCDSTTTAQSDIDKGIVNIVVGFAPLKPAEFVVIYIQQITGQLAV